MPVTRPVPHDHHVPGGQYTHIAVVPSGRLAFVAGQVAMDQDGEIVAPGDLTAQTSYVFRNLQNILDNLGATSSDIAELRTFIVGDDSVPVFREARKSAFDEMFPTGEYPPNTLLVVAGLASPDIVVEISAVVALPD